MKATKTALMHVSWRHSRSTKKYRATLLPRKLGTGEISKWFGISQFSVPKGKRGVPLEVPRKFRTKFPEIFWSIWFPTKISGVLVQMVNTLGLPLKTFCLFWKFSVRANQNSLTIYNPTEICTELFCRLFNMRCLPKRGYSAKFRTARLCPDVQTLAIILILIEIIPLSYAWNKILPVVYLKDMPNTVEPSVTRKFQAFVYFCCYFCHILQLFLVLWFSFYPF